MVDAVLFHHALGRTPGVVAFADRLGRGGHTLHVPDLYAGERFDTVEAGVAHAQHLGDRLGERVREAVEALPADLVYLGWSLGAMPAQRLAQTRPGARGVVLLEAFAPPQFFGAWPDGLRAQVHGMADDPWFREDLDAARASSEAQSEIELFTYAGHQHLFADDSTSAYDDSAAREVADRLLAFLARVEGS